MLKIAFHLAWHKPGSPAHRAFKLPGASDWMAEYAARIGRHAPCTVKGGLPEAGGRLWLLDRGKGSRVLSSEELAEALRRERDGGAARLDVLIGGPDGFSEPAIAALRPALRWSLGPLTLPHELAAVVAAEQVYRAWSILKRTPYHLGH